MASVIYGGNRELDLFISGEPHPATMQFMKSQAVALGQYIQNTGSTFAQQTLQVFNDFRSEDALRYARTALSRVKSYFQDDNIREIFELADFQNANSKMQRFIMSEETLRRMYHAGRCSGFAGQYVDPFPGQVGQDDYNWRRVMDGVMVEIPESPEFPEGSWKIQVFSEELLAGDRKLGILEQENILSTWERQRYLLKNFLDDISSLDGEML